VTITSVRKKSLTSFYPPQSPADSEGRDSTGSGGGISHTVNSFTNNHNSDSSDKISIVEGSSEPDGSVTVKIEAD